MSPYRRHTPAEALTALDELGVALEVYRRGSEQLARDFAIAVHGCLRAGATWGEIGRQLGMSKQAAREHWAGYIETMAAEREHQRTQHAPPPVT